MDRTIGLSIIGVGIAFPGFYGLLRGWVRTWVSTYGLSRLKELPCTGAYLLAGCLESLPGTDRSEAWNAWLSKWHFDPESRNPSTERWIERIKQHAMSLGMTRIAA